MTSRWAFLSIVVLALSCGRVSGEGERQEKKAKETPAKAKSPKQQEKGQLLWVNGPCGDRPCCKAFSVRLPEKLEPGVFSPIIGMKFFARPDGTVEKVEIVRSSGIEDVDRQLREGATRWCMEKTKEGREIYHTINIHVTKGNY